MTPISEKTRIRRETYAVPLAYVYTFAVAMLGVFVWFSYQAAAAVVIATVNQAWMSYAFYEIMLAILFAVLLLLATFAGSALFEKAIRAGYWIPKSLCIIIGSELALLVLSKVITRG